MIAKDRKSYDFMAQEILGYNQINNKSIPSIILKSQWILRLRIMIIGVGCLC